MPPQYDARSIPAPNNIWLIFLNGRVSGTATGALKMSYRQGNDSEKKLKIYVKKSLSGHVSGRF